MRWLAVFVVLSTLSGCTPCRSWAEKASQCDALADGYNVDSAEAVCNQEEPGLRGVSQTEWECVLSCTGRSTTCTQYYERAYLTCECSDECGIVCSD